MPAKVVRKRGFGSLIGSALGGLGSMFLPIPGINGSELGGALGGSLLPFRRGGAPRRKKAAKRAVKKRARGGK